ncbi:MAG TPA: hypothetical protein VMC42_08280 [Methanoregulaceae archaeon]|nr:hypothetical protein [Methanoregulaceae archaeon]
MTILEAILTILLIAVIVIAIYFYFKGSKGKLSITSPVESRVDEYLDRRFESMVTEWAMVRTPAVNRFKAQHEPVLDENEAKVSEIQAFEREINNTLSGMEDRLDHLEKELSQIK